MLYLETPSPFSQTLRYEQEEELNVLKNQLKVSKRSLSYSIIQSKVIRRFCFLISGFLPAPRGKQVRTSAW